MKKNKWKFNFVEEEMTEEDIKEYKKYGIKGVYSGRLKAASGYWCIDREHGMILTSNESPYRIEEILSGPGYYNFIYKGKVGIIGVDTNYELNQPCPFYFKEIILDKSLKDEEEYLCEAIKSAVFADFDVPVKKYIAEWPDKIEYR